MDEIPEKDRLSQLNLDWPRALITSCAQPNTGECHQDSCAAGCAPVTIREARARAITIPGDSRATAAVYRRTPRRRASGSASHTGRGGAQRCTSRAEGDYRGGRYTDPASAVGLGAASGVLHPNRSPAGGSSRVARTPHSCELTVVEVGTGGTGASGAREHSGPWQGGRTGVSVSGRSVDRVAE